MAGIRVEGSVSGNVAEVDSNNNLKVNLPTTMSQAGYDVNISEVDAGTITGASLRRAVMVTQGRKLAVGFDTPVFDYTFNATAQDTGIWKHAFVTMTCTEGAGSVLFNAAGNSTVAANTASLSTWRYFNLLGGAPLRVSMTLQITASALTNQVWEAGLFSPATGIADGVYFRYSSAGLVGIINYNSVETPTGVLLASIAPNTAVDLVIITGEGSTEFWADSGAGLILLGTLATPATQSEPFMSACLPLTVQQRNAGTVSGATQMQLKWTDCNIMQKSLALEMPYPNQMVLQKGNHQGLSGGTMGSLALYTNNLAPGAGAAMTNTTAALGTGLGGQFSALPTLAANTDGVICSYAVPAGTVNQTPRTLVITGVHISSMVTTALTGGPVQYFYSLAFGHSNVSLATSETGSFVTATAKAPRRVPLGCETFASAAAVGVTGTPGGIHIPFYSPIIVNPLEFIAVVGKNVGVVTTLGVITFLITFDHYWI
jgi:hypothetical protein